MALSRKKYTDIPSDAVVLTEQEALQYQFELLSTWKPTTDVLAYKWGPYILSGASFASGLFFNGFFRRKFHLGGHGKLASYLPVCVLPSLFSSLLHVEFVMRDVLLQKGNCPVCVQMRGAALQSFLGGVFPIVLGTLSSLAIAQQFFTYDIPYVTKEPIKVLKIVQKVIKPSSSHFLGILLAQALLGSAVTYLEGQSVYRVSEKLSTLERQMENN